MMNYSSGSTVLEPDSQWASLGFTAPSFLRFKESWVPNVVRISDVSVFTRDQVVSAAPAPASQDASAIPGELLTAAITSNLAGRRVLQGIFRKLAGDDEITYDTLASLYVFFEALPPRKSLPVVSPDGEGGLTLAWAVAGQEGRNLVTVADGRMYGIRNAGTAQSHFLPEAPVNEALSPDFLALIPE